MLISATLTQTAKKIKMLDKDLWTYDFGGDGPYALTLQLLRFTIRASGGVKHHQTGGYPHFVS